MKILNGLNKKAWLLMGLCAGLAGVVQAGTTYDTGYESQESSGTSTGTSGSSQGGAGTSPGTSDTSPGTSGTSPGTSGTSPGTSGTSPGTTGTSPGTTGTSPGTSGASQGTTGGMQGTQGMKIQSFQEVDKNSDSYVTKSELMDSPSLGKHFDKVDANKDGQLDENEYKNLIMENEQ
jgi:hypothetical protein